MAELKVGIGADNSGLSKGLKDAEAQISAFVSKVQNIGAIGEKLQGIGQKLSIGLTAPLVGLGVAAVKSYGDIEALKKGLEAVTGSADAANAEFNRLKEVAKLPGLGMQEAVKGSINLQAIGMDADKARNILSQFGNAVATVGKGRAEFERAIYGVQQLANTDFPLGEDLNIIKDALPQVSNLLKEAFGSSRSDELAKMGISSKQVLDVITKGLEDLPRVSGGINGAFENLGDAMRTNLARIGDIINKNLDISGLVEKLTSGVDKIVTWFEKLNPTIQSVILGVAAFAAALGPLTLAIGTVLAAIPTMIAGLGAIKIALLALTWPIGAVIVSVGLLAGLYTTFSEKTTEAERSQLEWADALKTANEAAAKQSNELAVLYKRTQDHSLSLAERKKAVDQLQAQYPSYFGNLRDEAILAGNAANVYENLRVAIVNASRARAAQTRLDKIELDALDKREKLLKDQKFYAEAYKNPKSSYVNYGGQGAGQSAEEYKEWARKQYAYTTKTLLDLQKTTEEQTANLIPIIERGTADISKVYGNQATAVTVGTGKVASAAVVGKEKIETALESIPNALKGGTSAIDDAFQIVTPDQLATFEANLNRIPQIVDEVALKNQLSFLNMREGLMEGFTAMNDINNLIGAAVQSAADAASNIIADSFSAMGEALTTGGNVLQAFGQSVLAGFGGFLSELGKMMIQYGVAGLAIAALNKFLMNPITAAPAAIAMIAAGAALSAAGGAIKGLVSGSKSGGGNVSTAAGGQSNYANTTSYSSGGGMEREFVFRIHGNDLVTVMAKNQERNSRIGTN